MNLNVNGKTIPLRVGVWCMDYFEKLEEADFRTSISRIGTRTMSSPNFLLAAAYDYCFQNNIKFEYTIRDAVAWYESDKSQCQEVIAEGLKSYIPKNSKSPQETGMQTST